MSTERDGGADVDWTWTEDEVEWIPPDVDTTRPSPARMYDYALGGKDNFAVDREAVERVGQVMPDFRALALANRAFLVAVVEAMARAGVRQFVDLGAGIPTSPSVHEAASRHVADPVVVSVDNDPVVAAHHRALPTTPGVVAVAADLRRPADVLGDPQVRRVLDLGQPVGLLMVSVLHFVRHEPAPEVVAGYRRAVSAGSRLAISTASLDGMDPAAVRTLESVYAGSSVPIVLRTSSQVERLFEGFELEEPGLVDVTGWRREGTPLTIRMLAGLGVKA